MRKRHPDHVGLAALAMYSEQCSDSPAGPGGSQKMYMGLYPSGLRSGWHENLVEQGPKVTALSFPLRDDDGEAEGGGEPEFQPFTSFDPGSTYPLPAKGEGREGSVKIMVNIPGAVDNPSAELEVFNAIRAFGHSSVCWFLWNAFFRIIATTSEARQEAALREMRRRTRKHRDKAKVKALRAAVAKLEDQVNQTEDPMSKWYVGVQGRTY